MNSLVKDNNAINTEILWRGKLITISVIKKDGAYYYPIQSLRHIKPFGMPKKKQIIQESKDKQSLREAIHNLIERN